MTVRFTGSMTNVNGAVNWHLGCRASPAEREEGAADRTPCSLTPACCCSWRLPLKWMLALARTEMLLGNPRCAGAAGGNQNNN